MVDKVQAEFGRSIYEVAEAMAERVLINIEGKS